MAGRTSHYPFPIASGSVVDCPVELWRKLMFIETSLRRSTAAALCFVGWAALAQGDEISVAGSSAGRVTGVSQLTWRGNAFRAMTSGGVGAFTGTNSLGTFSSRMAR